MFLLFKDQDGDEAYYQVRHIMAVWQSGEQAKLRPPICNFLMQCGSDSQIMLVQGELEDVLDKLRDCW
jgi:hypothetical protein